MTTDRKKECKAAYKYNHRDDESGSFTVYVNGADNVKKAEKICHKNNACYVRISNGGRYAGQIEPVSDSLAVISYVSTIADVRCIIDWLRQHDFSGSIDIYKSVYTGSMCNDKRVLSLHI